jgi:hypothetical protein
MVTFEHFTDRPIENYSPSQLLGQYPRVTVPCLLIPQKKLQSCNKYSLIIILLTTVSSQLHPTSVTVANLEYTHFTPSFVRHAIKKLSSRTKGGTDGMQPSFYINCCDELSQPLSLLFACCMHKSLLPSFWPQYTILLFLKKKMPLMQITIILFLELLYV